MSDDILGYPGDFDEEVNLVVAPCSGFEPLACLAVARLKKKGVPAIMAHSLVAGTLPLEAGATRFYVHEKHLSEACRILAEMEQNSKSEQPESYTEADMDDILFLNWSKTTYGA